MSILDLAKSATEERNAAARSGVIRANSSISDTAQPLVTSNTESGDQLTAEIGDSDRSPLLNGQLITLDRESLRRDGLLPPPHADRVVMSQFRVLKQQLLAASEGEAGAMAASSQCVVITSSISGEGKSFTALNLALSFARVKGQSVLLVDGDIAKKHLTTAFGRLHHVGFADLLAIDENIQVDDAIVMTDVPRLYFLGAGRARDDTADELCGSQLQLLMKNLRQRFENQITLIDTGPLLLTDEARFVTSIADRVIVVVMAESTTHKQLAESLEQIKARVNVHVLLNGSRSALNQANYYYDGPA